ncbi:MAG: hypothetical protein M1834_005396 [Cirrosporium novae-zelandiae]|nr:MAG: hypothetical protein M1834_005396 [Cirrosporium novae-zelandiae]
MAPPVTLYFLQASRSIRIAWLLEELNIPYNIEFADLENFHAPKAFKAKSGTYLGRSPTLKDGDLTIIESGAITEYLLETYDKENRLLPKDTIPRVRIREWIHASEATFVMHAIAILCTRGTLSPMLGHMTANLKNDLNWLEEELRKGGGKFLMGDKITAADTMMEYGVNLTLKKNVGTDGQRWEKIEGWLKNCHESETYKKAVQKSGYSLD